MAYVISSDEDRIARLERQVSALMTVALSKGDLTINGAREAAGLPAYGVPDNGAPVDFHE